MWRGMLIWCLQQGTIEYRVEEGLSREDENNYHRKNNQPIHQMLQNVSCPHSDEKADCCGYEVTNRRAI